MGSLSGGNGSLWGMGFFHSQEWNFERRRRRSSGEKEGKSSSNASKSSHADVNGGSDYRFPLKQAMTASSLALTGDTLAQLRDRWLKNKDTLPNPPHPMVNFLFLFFFFGKIKVIFLV